MQRNNQGAIRVACACRSTLAPPMRLLKSPLRI